jgi:hypothetical protein
MADNLINYFIFRDMRLKGNLSFMAASVITSSLDAATSLESAFSRLKMAVNMWGKIKTLFILCHGNGTG